MTFKDSGQGGSGASLLESYHAVRGCVWGEAESSNPHPAGEGLWRPCRSRAL